MHCRHFLHLCSKPNTSNMKKMMLLVALAITQMTFAQKKDTAFANAQLTNATVYYGYGAELKHSSKATLVNGMQQVIISNVAMQPDINTLQVACPENITILSFYHRIYTEPAKPRPALQPAKGYDTIKLLQRQVAAIVNEYQINEEVLRKISGLIENNFVTPDKKYISSTELVKLTNYYTGQVKQIRQKLFELHVKRTDTEEMISQISIRLSQTNQQEPITENPKPTGQLVMQVLAKGGGSVDFDFNYFTRNAGWVPTYDIRVKTIDNSFKLVYKALVSQTTGLNWDAVKLTLSTSNPNQGTTLPALSPLFLQLYVPALYQVQKDISVENNNMPQLSEVVVTASNLNKRNLNNSVSNVSDYTQLRESQLNTNFEIDLPYDIPSDGTAYSVTIKDEKLQATYQHFAIPKLDRDAFLLARLNRWDSLSLMPGQANIIMDNVYLGKSYLDPNTTADTLNLSLGRDKRIAISRKLVKDVKYSRSDNKTEIFNYEITIKNNKKQPLQMVLKDQYPLSREKEVEVTLTEDGKAMKVTETGILTWDVELQPGESRKIKFSYQVKYPKSKVLQETR